MPYGIPKSKRSPKAEAKMERCVEGIMSKPMKKTFKGRTKKESAIAMCKASLGYTKGGNPHSQKREAAKRVLKRLSS